MLYEVNPLPLFNLNKMLSKLKEIISSNNLEELLKLKKELEIYEQLVPVELFSEEYQESKEILDDYFKNS